MGENNLKVNKRIILFLFILYILGVYLRLSPRLAIDPHLLTFQGDIWYRLCMGQYIFDNWRLPEPDIRYLAYGYVPMWYPPLSPILFALASYISGLDIPTVSSRIVPFAEAASPLPIYFLARYLYGEKAGIIAAIALAATPNFVFWTGISDPQSFTLFMIPLLLLAWIWHSKQTPSNRRVAVFGVLLGINFLMHLSYFVEILVLFMVTIALILKREAEKRLLLDLCKVVLVSQVITSPWWLPTNLYWWWINALVTSSGLYEATVQLKEYGTFAAILGAVSFLYLFRDWRKHLVLILWALPIALETQNEGILCALGKTELTWHTIAKPLEGFRFFPFLAQPLAIAFGVLVAGIDKHAGERFKGGRNAIALTLIAIVLLAFSVDIQNYDLAARFQNSGLVVEEYEAALWFRENSLPSDRIIADYYRAEMFGGVSGGRALQGGEFPLRNVDYPYIKAPGEVLNHLFILYNTSDAEVAHETAKRYNATHVFYSDNMIRYGNLLSYYKRASEYGVDIEKRKFQNEHYFKIAYRKYAPSGEIVIVKVV